MEINSPTLEFFSEIPFQENRFSFQKTAASPQFSAKNRKKWKFIQEPVIHTRFSRKFTQIFLVFHLLICVLRPVSSQSWDGIIVTESVYQALQAFKHELIDPKNHLKSWNDTVYGVCSGSWTGIKCSQGQVIVIHLPWSGLGGRISEKIGQFQALRELSLHDNVIGAHETDAPIDWATRIKIAKAIARGLLYLHTKVGITHGNLTSSNVLLDEHKNAKISDYGLSRIMSSAANANVVATSGALGYRAPELLELKKATTKSDVYSFGVILLELLTGKSPGDLDLPQWVASIVKKEWSNEVLDVELMRDQSVGGDELRDVLKLALRCVELSPSGRPEARQILRQLEEIVRPETETESSGEDPFQITLNLH